MNPNINEILASQGWSLERESDTAFFFNHAPWVAPLAYLHTVFKPASSAALLENAQHLSLPEYWQNQLSAANGAILYSGAVNSGAWTAPVKKAAMPNSAHARKCSGPAKGPNSVPRPAPMARHGAKMPPAMPDR